MQIISNSNKKFLINLTGLMGFLLVHSCDASMLNTHTHSLSKNLTNPWSLVASIGYTSYTSMVSNDGQTPLMRLAINRTLFHTPRWAIGLETGVQNGNTMRLSVPQETLSILGGLPIQTTTKPAMDLLITLKKTWENSLFFLQGKTGVALQRWQFNDRDTINNLSQAGFEVQAGIGYKISSHTDLSLLYQGILNNNVNFTVNSVAQTGHASNIPTQHGILLSTSIVI